MKIKSHRGPELDTAGQSTQSEVRPAVLLTLQAGGLLHDTGFIGFYIPLIHISKFRTNKEYQEAADTNQSWQKATGRKLYPFNYPKQSKFRNLSQEYNSNKQTKKKQLRQK